MHIFEQNTVQFTAHVLCIYCPALCYVVLCTVTCCAMVLEKQHFLPVYTSHIEGWQSKPTGLDTINLFFNEVLFCNTSVHSLFFKNAALCFLITLLQMRSALIILVCDHECNRAYLCLNPCLFHVCVCRSVHMWSGQFLICPLLFLCGWLYWPSYWDCWCSPF